MSLSIPPYTLTIFHGELPEVFYLIGSEEEGRAVFEAIPLPRPALIAVDGADWDRDLSPWPAPKAFRGGSDFSGGAAAFLGVLVNDLVPMAEQELDFIPEHRGLAGYSLAGLFAVWALWEGAPFDRFASMSGSLWFDGFTDYAAAHQPKCRPVNVSLSLGDGEKKTRNPRMARVEESTQTVIALLEKEGIPVTFHAESGGHFNDVNGRIARGIVGTF